MNEPMTDYIIVGADPIVDHAVHRNRGFIEIMYSGEQLAELAFSEYQARCEHRSSGVLENNLYVGQAYAGSDEDKLTFQELMGQLTDQFARAIEAGVTRANTHRPVVGAVYTDFMVFLRLG